MYCFQCGMQLACGFKYCPRCGTKCFQKDSTGQRAIGANTITNQGSDESVYDKQVVMPAVETTGATSPAPSVEDKIHTHETKATISNIASTAGSMYSIYNRSKEGSNAKNELVQLISTIGLFYSLYHSAYAKALRKGYDDQEAKQRARKTIIIWILAILAIICIACLGVFAFESGAFSTQTQNTTSESRSSSDNASGGLSNDKSEDAQSDLLNGEGDSSDGFEYQSAEYDSDASKAVLTSCGIPDAMIPPANEDGSVTASGNLFQTEADLSKIDCIANVVGASNWRDDMGVVYQGASWDAGPWSCQKTNQVTYTNGNGTVIEILSQQGAIGVTVSVLKQ